MHRIAFSLLTIYACFTHSQGILFEAKNAEEEKAGKRVVEACKTHPAGITVQAECENNLRCFPQPD